MWNRRKDEDNQPKPAQTPTSAPPAVQSRETQPVMSSTPMKSYDPPVSTSHATIGKAVMIKGQIFSREDLIIDGEVEGTVEAQEHRVTVGPNGKVQAGVKAREIEVQGSIHGNVEATDKIEIKKEAKLIGDIKTARIVIEDGAYFKGSIDINKSDAKPQSQQIQQPARVERIERKEPVVAQVTPVVPATVPGK